MKKKILLIFTILISSVLLFACSPKDDHEIELIEQEALVLWNSIEIKFIIEGEDDTYKIASDSLEAFISKEGKTFNSKKPTYVTADEIYRVSFSDLSLNTEYELIITASINQEKVTLFQQKYTTLLDGGDVNNPILVNTVEDWKNITNSYAFYKLGSDIDFGGELLPEIFSAGLRGGFDGNNKTLKNFKISYDNFNGIFGNMSTGTAKVHDLVIENVTYDNVENIDNKQLTSLYVGLITKEVAKAVKISNITFKNMDVKVYTQLYGIRYFGLVTATNRGTIENITMENVDITVVHNSHNVTIIGGVVGKNYADASLSKVYFKSGSFTLETGEFKTTSQTIETSYYGAIVGEGSGEVKEVYSNANLNVVDKDIKENEKVIVFEGSGLEHKVEGDETFSKNKKVVVENDKSVEVKITVPQNQEIKHVLVNGVDKTSEIDEDTLTLLPSEISLLVQVEYKIIDQEELLKITGDNFTVKLVDVEEGEDGENEEEFSLSEIEYGQEVIITPTKIKGFLIKFVVNGVSYFTDENELRLVVDNNLKIEVITGQNKTVYLGGIVGGGSLENAVFAGDITINIKGLMDFKETFNFGALAGRSYKKIINSAVIGSEANISTTYGSHRSEQFEFLAVTIRKDSIISLVELVDLALNLNGEEVLIEDLESVLSEDVITSEFILDILN